MMASRVSAVPLVRPVRMAQTVCPVRKVQRALKVWQVKTAPRVRQANKDCKDLPGRQVPLALKGRPAKAVRKGP